MKLKNKIILPALFSLVMLAACGSGQKKQLESNSGPRVSGVEGVPFAHISTPDTIDMGIFDYKTPAKITEIQYTNTGDALLLINSAGAECDCTQILSVDSVVKPGESGILRVQLDLGKYLEDTIVKSVHMVTNDPDRQVVRISLRADCRM